jgi:hypothetical protein
MEEMLFEKVRQRTFLYDTKSPDYRDQHIRANTWEGIGKELKIKCKFYVSSRDVRIVCPWLNISHGRENLIADRGQKSGNKFKTFDMMFTQRFELRSQSTGT